MNTDLELTRPGGIEMANTIPNAATGPDTTATQKGFIREMLMAQDPEGYCANCKAIQTASPPEYAKVKCPVLIIAGDQDKSAPVSGCQYIHDQLGSQNKKLEVLKGIGHWYCVEAPDQVGPLVSGFIEQL
jgi:pimeloyl-ACP methyl ester carboxylesterase